MPDETDSFGAFFARYHPFDTLSAEALAALSDQARRETVSAGTIVFDIGDPVAHFRAIRSGTIDLMSAEGALVSQLTEGDGFGARSLFRDGVALLKAVASTDVVAYALPAADFLALAEKRPAIRAFYTRPRRPVADEMTSDGDASLVGVPLKHLMTSDPISVSPTTSIRDAAAIMADNHISCVLIAEDDRLVGIVTTGDLAGRVISAGRNPGDPVSSVMTRDPVALSPEASGFDAMLAMSEKAIGHLPIVEEGRPVGILTRTNLVRRQQVSAVYMIGDIARLSAIEDLAGVVGQVPALLAQLVGAGVQAHQVGHIVTSVTDALTRRLMALAEERFGPPPIPYLWLACGSQGRSEQTGISDQDNCLILDDAYDEEVHGAYFEQLAKYVSDGLDACGYFYCPGDMMATNPRWRQPLRTWRGYFHSWIAKPDPMAQMLSSVMFDLRPIVGDAALFDGLQAETLALAAKNSIFRAHMIANSLKHTPPLNIFRGFALIRSGEHKDTVDLKHNGVVPIVDLARVYALEGRVEAVNTRERLFAARAAGTLSKTGASDLVDAYDLIAGLRLDHQARQIRAGEKPDNYLAPSTLSALERNHLKDAFGVIKTMQSALGHGRAPG